MGVPVFPYLTSVADDFNRANGPVGGNWLDDPDGGLWNEFNVASNQLAPAAADAWMYYNVLAGLNCEGILEIPVYSDSPFEIEIRFGGQETGQYDFYMLQIASATADNWVMQKVLNAGRTTLASGFLTRVPAGGDAIGIRAMGSRIECFYRYGSSWTKLGSADDPSYLPAGRAGVYISATTTRGDNFYYGSVPVIDETNIYGHRRRRRRVCRED